MSIRRCSRSDGSTPERQHIQMILVRQTPDNGYEVIHGHVRLRVALEAPGRAEVVDAASGAVLTVHELDGRLVALTPDAQAAFGRAVDTVIARARGRDDDRQP